MTYNAIMGECLLGLYKSYEWSGPCIVLVLVLVPVPSSNSNRLGVHTCALIPAERCTLPVNISLDSDEILCLRKAHCSCLAAQSGVSYRRAVFYPADKRPRG